ncbi:MULTISPECIES: EF-hand domain-containing protein [unclassified Luteimonas]|uniref:EF-hand domain-containing protein n=1 Tax=unclassified Luteimonas TaxID=2629088 RepID=UPI001602B515|nr:MULTISPECIES: EF-hand domain-containing protein [unclassified Luteimonas]MBB1472075.1 EF-hand domain-containing protein [Luteimonas sp. MC1782]MBB6599200.1 EF-hand domain-containing protein [Luteimonas sp. MC1825]QOC89319.1 EF-hand domain-containing protein [Luteimonas sp. MC1825]
MSKPTNKPVALAMAALGGIALSGSAFAMHQLGSGYMAAGTAVSAQATGEPAAKTGEGTCGMSKVDSDGDGRISAAEFTARHPDKDAAYFAAMDVNSDGFVDQAEHDAHHAEKKAGDGKAAQEGKCGEGKCGEGKCGGAA